MQVGEGTKEKKPKRVSIPKNFEPDEIGLNTAIQLLGLPRKLGFHPETNKEINNNKKFSFPGGPSILLSMSSMFNPSSLFSNLL